MDRICLAHSKQVMVLPVGTKKYWSVHALLKYLFFLDCLSFRALALDDASKFGLVSKTLLWSSSVISEFVDCAGEAVGKVSLDCLNWVGRMDTTFSGEVITKEGYRGFLSRAWLFSRDEGTIWDIITPSFLFMHFRIPFRSTLALPNSNHSTYFVADPYYQAAAGTVIAIEIFELWFPLWKHHVPLTCPRGHAGKGITNNVS